MMDDNKKTVFWGNSRAVTGTHSDCNNMHSTWESSSHTKPQHRRGVVHEVPPSGKKVLKNDSCWRMRVSFL